MEDNIQDTPPEIQCEEDEVEEIIVNRPKPHSFTIHRFTLNFFL